MLTIPTRWLRVLKIVAFGAVVVFVGLFLIRNYDALRSYSYQLDPGFALAAILLVVVGQHCNALAWVVLDTDPQEKYFFQERLWLWFYSRLSRYIPGKFAWILVRMSHSKSKMRSGITSILEIATSLVAVILVVLVLALLSPGSLPKVLTTQEFVIAIAASLILAAPFLQRLFNALANRLVAFDSSFSWSLSVLSVACLWQIAAIFFHSGSLLCFLLSMGGANEGYAFITIAYFISGVSSMFAVFAPAGLGVREGVLVYFLVERYDVELAVIVSIIVRAIGIATEVGLGALWLVIFRYRIRTRGRGDPLGISRQQ